ncbi:MAG TPA: gamma-glutamyl-gamma-aminobutyrate hydrolase family protein [Thermodesulfobacteriota bacterium]|nr:gamma-glutamyl-gamma-aminobutyrate hydrolase family protein [Thermodesulfobacteriota bacterium]
MRVLVLRHVPHEHLGTLESALRAADLGFRYLDLFENYSPSTLLESYDGLVILGGPMNVYETDKYPFLEMEDRLIKETIERQMPVLGICLGAQLIAKALGAGVTKNREKEIGWYPLKISEEARGDELFKYLNKEETVFQWHGDTFEIPKGAVHLAESPLCKNQAFRFGSNVYALQFHIEVTPQMISEWLNVPENREEIKPLQEKINPETIKKETPNFIERLNILAESVFGGFCKLVKNR